MWNDLNSNGIETANEPLMPGLTVRLMKDGVAEGSPATTGTNGAYSFAFVRNSAAVYTVQFARPAGYRFTDPRQGTDFAVDGDAEANGVSLPLTFPSPRNVFISAGLVSAPTVEITYDNAKNKTGGLQVAKWENAFNIAGTAARIKGVDAATGRDIIDLDPDRFNVWVKDKAKWAAGTGHVTVDISTTNVAGLTSYNDTATTVDMVRFTGTDKGTGIAGEGWYWSDSQILVSNTIDDTEAVPGVGADDVSSNGTGKVLGPVKNGSQWYVSDRTHQVALRGTVKAEYFTKANVAGVTDTKSVPVRHTIRATVYILNGENPVTHLQVDKGVVIQNDVNADFRRSNELYAQVGIQFVHDLATRTPWNGFVNLGDGLAGYNGVTDGKIDLDQESKDLLSTGSKISGLGTVKVYYVNYFGDAFGPSERRGESIIMKLAPFQYSEDSVIISSQFRSLFTLAHEIGHVLTNIAVPNGGHETTGSWPVNVMRTATSTADTIDASKRFTLLQDTLMNSERKILWS